jgi:PKHD-type hydroxylase
MPYILQQPRLEKFPPYVFFKDEFTKEECERVIALKDKLVPLAPAVVGSNDNPVVDPKIRASSTTWINWNADADWVFQKLEHTVNKIRQNWYPFHLSGFVEPLQLTHYTAAQEGHYDVHKDMGDGAMSVRKLSLAMLLNDPATFKGGEFEMLSIPGPVKTVSEVGQGTVIAFPSWELHRVAKVIEGERWSLVSWVHGPPFV